MMTDSIFVLFPYDLAETFGVVSYQRLPMRRFCCLISPAPIRYLLCIGPLLFILLLLFISRRYNVLPNRINYTRHHGSEVAKAPVRSLDRPNLDQNFVDNRVNFLSRRFCRKRIFQNRNNRSQFIGIHFGFETIKHLHKKLFFTLTLYSIVQTNHP